MADRFGHNRLLVASAVGATGAALLAAAAPTLELLIAAKGIQAGCLAGLGVSSIAILVRETPAPKLATGLGVWAFWTATSGVLGPVLSSALVDIASWRLMFVATAVVSGFVLWLAWPGLRDEFRPTERAPVDWPGTLAAVAGLSLLVLTLLEANDWGWSSARTAAGGSIGVALVAVVIVRSRHAVDPTIPLHVFTNRNFTVSGLISFTASIAFFGMWLALLSYAVDVWDQSLIGTGLLLTLMPGTMTLFARASGRLADARGERGVMIVGALLFSIGFAVTAMTVGAEQQPALLLPAIIGGGVGMASVLSNATSVGTATLDPDLLGTGTAILQTAGKIAGSLGSALVVVLLDTGEIGDVATHRRPLWMIAALGVVVAAMSTTLQNTRVRPERDVSHEATV
jgi:MFS family permease